MPSRQDDTIAAMATPPGAGALAVIRLSGPAALRIADDVFRGTSPLSDSPGYTAHYGRILSDEGTDLDDVVVTVFHSPRSYTGEDMAEFSCHGGSLMPRRVLRALIARGARQAHPGEFTRRAFLNGRIDLAQAEAVAELIASGSELGQLASLEQLHGALSRRVAEIRSSLLEVCALTELGLDFIEENIEIVDNKHIAHSLSGARQAVDSLLLSYAAGLRLRAGISVTIIGPPNAGKSSIFNSLLATDRAIVTPHPGTTRDMLEENIGIGGYLFRLRDTAGIREAVDPAEIEGIRRSEMAVSTADILLIVLDASLSVTPPPEKWTRLGSLGQKQVLLLNKIDLLREAGMGARVQGGISVSARTGEGLDRLRSRLLGLASELTGGRSTENIAVNERHRGALERVRASLDRALETLSAGKPHEFVALDLRAALEELSEITGEVTTDDILDRIFSSFCIGK